MCRKRRPKNEDRRPKTLWSQTKTHWSKTKTHWSKTKTLWSKTKTHWSKTKTLGSLIVSGKPVKKHSIKTDTISTHDTPATRFVNVGTFDLNFNNEGILGNHEKHSIKTDTTPATRFVAMWVPSTSITREYSETTKNTR